MTSDIMLEEFEMTTARHKPIPIAVLTKETKFTKQELQVMYRGFKQECPSGIVNENTFKELYAQFFPQGSNSDIYAHRVFSTFDLENRGALTFEQIVHALSLLARGSQYEKLQWVFHLYDANNDGVISKSEMIEIVHAIYELMGRHSVPVSGYQTAQAHAEEIFYKMDLNGDGFISLDEFMESCNKDKRIFQELSYFNTVM